MSMKYYIKAELNHKLDFKMQHTFFLNMLNGNYRRVAGYGEYISERAYELDDYDEAMKFFIRKYRNGYFWYYCSGNMGKNSGAPVELTAEESGDFAACSIHLDEHCYGRDREELFQKEDFRWHLQKLLEITNPYPIKRIWQENDAFYDEGVKHSSDFVVEGEVIYSWSWSGDVVQERTAYHKGMVLEVLETILANGLAYGAEFEDFYFELITEKPFPQEIVIKTKYGKFIVVLEDSFLIRVKPYYFLQDVSDVRSYAEILVALTRGLGLSSFRIYAGEKQPIAL